MLADQIEIRVRLAPVGEPFDTRARRLEDVLRDACARPSWDAAAASNAAIPFNRSRCLQFMRRSSMPVRSPSNTLDAGHYHFAVTARVSPC